MNVLKKIWPLLALLVVGPLIWVWYATQPHPQDLGNKNDLNKAAQESAPAAKTPVPEPTPVLPTASGSAAPEALVPQAPPPPVPEKQPAEAAKVPSSSELAKDYSVATKKFRTFQQAEQFLTLLRQQGHRTYITKEPQDTKPFIVWLGPYATRQEAETVADTIKRKYRVATQVEAKEILPPK
jgi:cell division septation protein DedD